jgi:hypothetical protein
MLKCGICAGKIKNTTKNVSKMKKQRLQNDNVFISSIAKRGAKNALLQQK